MKNISGPVFVARLKRPDGRVVYVFGDIHLPLHSQTECGISEEDTLFIDVALQKVFRDNPENKYALFVEMSTKITNTDMTRMADIYINRVRMLTLKNPHKNVSTWRFDVRLDDPLLLAIHNDINSPLRPRQTFAMIIESLCYNISLLQKTIQTKSWVQLVLKSSETIREDFQNLMTLLNVEYKKLLNLREKMMTWGKMFEKHKDKFKNTLKTYEKFEKKFINIADKIQVIIAYLTDTYLFYLMENDTSPNISYVYTGLSHVIHITNFLIHKQKCSLTHHTTKEVHSKDIFHGDYNLTYMIAEQDNMLGNLGYMYTIDTTQQCIPLDSFPPNLS
jgi:hypothetical protein